MARLKRLLITGAAGALGSQCRTRLAHLADRLVLADRVEITDPAQHEEVVQCDMADADAVMKMVDGCDGIAHFGGQSVEGSWAKVRPSNIDGMYNLYEAARLSSVTPRIVFASSNHAIGFHPNTERLDGKTLPRPDTLYGVSKVFGEALASMYHDKFGIETASIRIGSCFPEPANHRMLATWLSYGDLARLVERIFTVPHLGCPVIYGASDNQESLWDNGHVAYIGWRPEDSAEEFRAKLDAANGLPPKDDGQAIYHGGAYAEMPIEQS